MRIHYDTEFLEDGHTIELISIGMVSETGSELYLINNQAPWGRISNHKWLAENVVKKLYMDKPTDGSRLPTAFRSEIRDQVKAFLLSHGPKLELWAWFGAYDHVALAQLFGPMSELPEGIPYYTNDVRQEHVRLGKPELPVQDPSTQHHALYDARHCKLMHDTLIKLESEKP